MFKVMNLQVMKYLLLSMKVAHITIFHSSIAPKKGVKRLLQHSPICDKVYKSSSFSTPSRMKIYNNETRLASLLNGYMI